MKKSGQLFVLLMSAALFFACGSDSHKAPHGEKKHDTSHAEEKHETAHGEEKSHGGGGH